tara:strand:+ start:17568 stop:18794 length:1227 start_codon:yes stop_codon:yes gene_type:complete
MDTVIVLGTDSPIGLAVIRDLGRHNYNVIGFGSHPFSLGLMSKYCSKGMVRNSTPELLIEQLIDVAETYPNAFLVSIGESDINLVNRHRQRLEQHLTLLDPDAEQMAKVLDKSQTLEIASTLAIQTPASFQIDSLEQLATLQVQLKFPVILKWSNPHQVAQQLQQQGLSLLKLEYCQDLNELKDALSKYQAIGQYPLIQHYCPGYGIGQFFLCREGDSLVEFQHQRINEWPPEGGSSTLCQALSPDQHTGCMAQSRQLLKALNWNGVAMVEYRYEPVTNSYWLMEINGRFWGSLPLATRSDVSFASSLVEVIGKQSNPVATSIKYDLQSRYMIPEIKRLIRILFQPQLITDPNVSFSALSELGAFTGRFLKPNIHSYVFEWEDPKPFLSDMRNAARKVLRKLFKHGSD